MVNCICHLESSNGANAFQSDFHHVLCYSTDKQQMDESLRINNAVDNEALFPDQQLD